MTKPERLEDLGRIREKLDKVINNLEDDWGQYISSKHDYEAFEEHLLDNNNEKIYDLHIFLRFHKELLEEILCIAIGDISD